MNTVRRSTIAIVLQLRLKGKVVCNYRILLDMMCLVIVWCVITCCYFKVVTYYHLVKSKVDTSLNRGKLIYMKKLSLFITLLAINTLLLAQEEGNKVYNVSQIQGIWQMYANYTYPTQDSFYKVYHIFKGREWLTVDLSEDLNNRFSVVVSEYGFSNYSMYDDFSEENIADNGKFFVQVINEKGRYLYNVSIPFQLEKKKSLIIFRDECGYIDNVPKEVLNFLYKRGQNDKRDYIREFLDMQVCALQTEKSFIYDTTLTKTKMYLVKDDIITVTGEKSSFVKMEYETAKGDTIKGWIKKEDVK